MIFSIEVDNVVLDLFDDEQVTLTRQIKDLSDLKSVYTDYTQSFQIPATDVNNGVFQNFFDENVLLQSWNQYDGLDATIYVHGIPIFVGVVELTEVNFKNGLPRDYSITFYGRTKNAMLAWGEKTLQEVDWSAYDHAIDNTIVQSSWTGGLLSGDVVWDLKDYGFQYTYSEYNIGNNVRQTQNITFEELRPSIKVSAMLTTVFADIGITLSGSLLGRSEFDNMFITPMNDAGPMKDRFQLQSGLVEANNSTPQLCAAPIQWLLNWQPLPLGDTTISDPSGAWDSANYKYTMQRTGSYTFRWTITSHDNINAVLQVKVIINGLISSLITTKSDMDQWLNDPQLINIPKGYLGDEIQIVYKTTEDVNIEGTFECIDSPWSLDPAVEMYKAMPPTKIVDFVNGILKTFNGILVPVSDTEIEIHNISDWYGQGNTKHFTDYIDMETINHKKVPIPKTIEFKHAEGTTMAHKKFKEVYDRPFGSVKFSPNVDFAEGELKVETPFTVFPMTLIEEVNKNGIYVRDTTLYWNQVYDEGGKPSKCELILFYFQPPVDTSYFYFYTDWLMQSPRSMFVDGDQSTSNSLAFGLEGTLEGDIPVNTLYMSFWNEHISRLYSTRSRIVSMNINLPVAEWLNLQLNDTIVISGNYYKIEKLTYNLNKEQGVIELMTYPNVELSRITGSSGRIPSWTDPIQADAGKTFIYGHEMKVNVSHASWDGTDYLTDSLDITQYPSSEVKVAELYRNYLPTISLNKICIFEQNPQTILFDVSPAGLNTGSVVQEGDQSRYDYDLATGKVIIQQNGQYKMKGTVVLDNSGSHLLDIGIKINGFDTEATSWNGGNHTMTYNVECTSTLAEGSEVTLTGQTQDGGSHNIDVLKVFLIVESII